jgi:hypothetical protein
MRYWVVCSDCTGGPVYLPQEPYGVEPYYKWAPWSSFIEYAQRFESRELAEERMVGLTLEGMDMSGEPMLVG